MFKTVVLALDGSESSDRALEYASAIAIEHDSHLRVVHVIEIFAGRSGGTLHLDENELRAKIEKQVEGLTGAGFDAELEVHSSMIGGPASVIAEVAERVEADVIVTGTRGHTAIVGVILGSVPQRLLHLAPCATLIVPLAARQPVVTSHAATAAAAAG